MRVFIVYHHQDRLIALRITRCLRDSGYQVWCACLGRSHPDDKRAFLRADYVVLTGGYPRLIQGAKRHQKQVIVARSGDEVVAQLSSLSSNTQSRRWLLGIVAVIGVFVAVALLYMSVSSTKSINLPTVLALVQAQTFSPTPRPSSTSTPTKSPPTITSTPLPTATPTMDFTATVIALQDLLFGTTEPVTDLIDDDVPFASLYAEPLYGEAPLTVTFYNDSFGDAVEYLWDFDGDGVTDSTEFEPSPFTYAEPGEYWVSLWALNEAGEGEPAEMQIIVYGSNADDPVALPTATPTHRPTPNANEVFASFVSNPSTGYAPLTVNFLNDTLGNAASYAWDFNGDGMTDSTASNPPAYTYTTEGEYSVSLSVVSVAGFSDRISATVFVYPSEEVLEEPIASFTTSVQSDVNPLTVAFTNTTTGQATVFLWDFNSDGVTDSREQNPAPYTYQRAGNYSPRLLVSGPGGVSAPFTLQINVNPADSRTATLTASPTPTLTQMPTSTATSTSTRTATAAPTLTVSYTSTATTTAIGTLTHLPTVTATPSATAEDVTATPAVTITTTATPEANDIILETPLQTAILTATYTTTPTLTFTATP